MGPDTMLPHLQLRGVRLGLRDPETQALVYQLTGTLS